MLETVKTLCALSGVSGWEDEVREYILSRVLETADEVDSDAMGNLYARKKGLRSPERPLMLAAHMDEVGLIVTGCREDGSLRFAAVGGIDTRVLLGKRVFVGPGKLPGVIGRKAIHLLTKEQRETVPKLEELYIDIGAESEEEACRLAERGVRVSFDPTVRLFGEGYIKAKALDDRVGCAAMLKLLERDDLPLDICCVFTVQEEVGCRGAVPAANRLQPSFALVLEGTTAADIGGVEEGKQVCRLGHGVVIPFMDGGTVYSPALYRKAGESAARRGIPWQTKERIAGGTDASAIQKSGCGCRVLTLSAPLRSIHSPASVGKISDMEALPGLCFGIMEDIANGEYDI